VTVKIFKQKLNSNLRYKSLTYAMLRKHKVTVLSLVKLGKNFMCQSVYSNKQLDISSALFT